MDKTNILDIVKPILFAASLYMATSVLIMESIDIGPEVDHVVPDEYGLVIRA